MYYVLYTLIKLLSWIPLRLLYLLGDLVYVILFYITGYRKKVVLQNLAIAFPEKTAAERYQIAQQFYHHFCDSFMEMLKLFSWSQEKILQRMKGNTDVLNQWVGKDQSIQLIAGHFFNWEIANLAIAALSKIPFVAVYMPLTNKAINRMVYDMRKKTGTILIPATDFAKQSSNYLKEQYVLVLAADQTPGNPKHAYWLNFFSKPAPFVRGPEIGAAKKNTAIIYVHFYPVKRGYYQFQLELITDDPAQLKEGELTKLIVQKTEDCIRQYPANYLWSHRRWKHEWKEEYRDLWVDN